MEVTAFSISILEFSRSEGITGHFYCFLILYAPAVQSPWGGKTTITGVHTNQDLIWSVKIGVYMGFGSIVGPDYHGRL